jgi:uncharacterized membrane protein YkgB
MTTHSATLSTRIAIPTLADVASRAAMIVLRGGLIGILVWLGAFKFTDVEARAIEPLVANSPLLGWLYAVASVQGVSNLIGSSELAIAGLMALRGLSPRACAIGSLAAVGMFLTTLTFLATTPGLWDTVPGFPLPVTNETGFFLVKDVFLLGAALASAAEALGAIESH